MQLKIYKYKKEKLEPIEKDLSFQERLIRLSKEQLGV